MNLLKRFLKWIRGPLYTPDGDFYTHECVFCKRDPDASYCIPNPEKKES